jgi:hypothetical protein
MGQHVQTTSRDAVLVEDAGLIRMMGMPVLINLAREDKQAEPRALVLHRDQLPVRKQGDAIVRTLVGEGSPVQLGTPALILDVELPDGGQLTTPVPPESRASPTWWTAKPPSARTGAG